MYWNKNTWRFSCLFLNEESDRSDLDQIWKISCKWCIKPLLSRPFDPQCTPGINMPTHILKWGGKSVICHLWFIRCPLFYPAPPGPGKHITGGLVWLQLNYLAASAEEVQFYVSVSSQEHKADRPPTYRAPICTHILAVSQTHTHAYIHQVGYVV